MEYKWNKNKLYKNYLLAKFFNDKEQKELFNMLLKIANKENFEQINTKEINYDYIRKYYLSCSEYINEDFYNICLDLFYIFNDITLIDQKYTYEQIDLSNKDLITLTRDIIKTFHKKDMLSYFDYLIKNNYFNIDYDDNRISENTYEKNNGITFYDYKHKKNYIHIYRYNTVEDIDTTLHEFFHAYYESICKDKKTFHLLPEFEGLAGSIYASIYLNNLNIKDSTTMRKELFTTILTDSFYLIINHLLLKNNFNIPNTNKDITNLKFQDEIILTNKSIKDMVYINSFTTCANIISYLILLDIINYTENPIEFINIVSQIKENDHENILSNIEKYNFITFYKDEVNNIKKERQLFHK